MDPYRGAEVVYQEAFKRVEYLMFDDPNPDEREIELLTFLIEFYDERKMEE
jgi:hypothetical protein